MDAKTGLVEGILVRGENDYVLDSARRCNIVNVCEEGKCRGDIIKPKMMKGEHCFPFFEFHEDFAFTHHFVLKPFYGS